MFAQKVLLVRRFIPNLQDCSARSRTITQIFIGKDNYSDFNRIYESICLVGFWQNNSKIFARSMVERFEEMPSGYPPSAIKRTVSNHPVVSASSAAPPHPFLVYIGRVHILKQLLSLQRCASTDAVYSGFASHDKQSKFYASLAWNEPASVDTSSPHIPPHNHPGCILLV